MLKILMSAKTMPIIARIPPRTPPSTQLLSPFAAFSMFFPNSVPEVLPPDPISERAIRIGLVSLRRL